MTFDRDYPQSNQLLSLYVSVEIYIEPFKFSTQRPSDSDQAGKISFRKPIEW